MSSKKSHRLRREAAARAANPIPAQPKQEWPIQRHDMNAVGYVKVGKDRALVIGEVWQHEDGTVFYKFPEGTELVGDVEFSYDYDGRAEPQETEPCQSGETGPIGGSRYKRGRRWWEHSVWDRRG